MHAHNFQQVPRGTPPKLEDNFFVFFKLSRVEFDLLSCHNRTRMVWIWASMSSHIKDSIPK